MYKWWNGWNDEIAWSFHFFLISFLFRASLPTTKVGQPLPAFFPPQTGLFCRQHSGYLTLHASRATKANSGSHLMCYLQRVEIGKVKRKLVFLLTIFWSAERMKWAHVNLRVESRGKAASSAKVCLGDHCWGKEGIGEKKQEEKGNFKAKEKAQGSSKQERKLEKCSLGRETGHGNFLNKRYKANSLK